MKPNAQGQVFLKWININPGLNDSVDRGFDFSYVLWRLRSVNVKTGGHKMVQTQHLTEKLKN